MLVDQTSEYRLSNIDRYVALSLPVGAAVEPVGLGLVFALPAGAGEEAEALPILELLSESPEFRCLCKEKLPAGAGEEAEALPILELHQSLACSNCGSSRQKKSTAMWFGITCLREIATLFLMMVRL